MARSTLRGRSHPLQLGTCSSRRKPASAAPWRRGIFTPSLASLSSTSSSGDASANKHDNNTGSVRNESNSTNIDNATGKGSRSSNANPAEVDKFSSFASRWWDARSNPLVGMNPIRVKFMMDVVENLQTTPETGLDDDDAIPTSFHLPLRNKRILDIGCGGGLLTESLSRLGASSVVGLDASSAVVEVAKLHSFHDNSRLNTSDPSGATSQSCIGQEDGNIRYIGGVTVEELASQIISSPQNDSESDDRELFDVITALEVIEHVPDPTSLLQAAATLLKPDGILFVSTINRTAKSYGLAIVAAEYISGKVPVGTHDWNQFWSPEEVRRMVVRDGEGDASCREWSMKQIALSGMVIEPPFVNMRWSLDATDLDVNWIGAYQKEAIA